MHQRLVGFLCAGCGHQTYRYDHVYERMRRERGQAWCILCAPLSYRSLLSSRELVDVSHALIKRSHQKVAATRSICPRSSTC
jgi:hypothetical protein